MILPDNLSEQQDAAFHELMKKRFGDVEPSDDLNNLLYEFYLTGAKDSIELIEKRIVENG